MIQFLIQSYAEDCRIYTPELSNKISNVWKAFEDIHVIAHFVGWWGKMIIIRDLKMAWLLSFIFEVLEITFKNWLPNF